MQAITNNFEETQKVAEEFAKSLRGGEVLCLYGDLGRGKTTFTQGLAKGLGVNRNVNSPTFIIMRSYRSELPDYVSNDARSTRDARTRTLYHIDLYRLEQEQEMIDLGILDIMNDPENVVVIEWPEKLGSLLPEKRIDIHFEYIDENKRAITIRRQ